jgi:hypothetical protein
MKRLLWVLLIAYFIGFNFLLFFQSEESLNYVVRYLENESSSRLYPRDYQVKLDTRQPEKRRDRQSKISLYHGRVLEELCQRVLSRSVAQSNVLIVSPDIDAATTQLPDSSQPVQKGPSKVVASHANSQGHTTYLLPTFTNMNQWWKSMEESNNQAKWFLMAYFAERQYRDEEVKQSIDDMLNPSRFTQLLEEATLTYIVIAVHARANGNKKGRFYDTSESNITMSGLTAVQTLLDSKYKVQLLASSHLDANQVYRPNHLFRSNNDVGRFLSSGARFALETSDDNFHALLFATQGLDLAIPSRRSYLSLKGLDLCTDYATYSGRCDAKLNPFAKGQDVFMKCPKHHSRVSIEFDDKSTKQVSMMLDNETINKSDIELWLGHENVTEAEVACMRIKDPSIVKSIDLQPVACTTRILKQDLKDISKKEGLPGSGSNPKPNLLSILIDPISRDQFHRSLPNTTAILKELGFIHFPKYTVVGDNSGPNQAALYTGHPLVGGREGIKASTSHGHDDIGGRKWLWDIFGAEGYATLKAEDICVQNSNMIQSMKPKTHHGEQLYRMFCFDFDRPNCLGKDMAAKHLIDYAKQFMDAYGDKSGNAERWAAMLSFVDSHEDTLTLISYLDEIFVEFLHSIDLKNTIVILSSDHGLHYGPTFQSNGEKERGEPILYFHFPRSIDPGQLGVVNDNTKFWTTPFDVHETILDATLQRSSDGTIGKSLLRPLGKERLHCDTTPGVPRRFCEILNPIGDKPKKCTFIPGPPSVFSFYADISREHRPSWPECTRDEGKSIQMAEKEECLCATNQPRKESWIPCNSPQLENIDKIRDQKADPLRMKRCKISESSPYINLLSRSFLSTPKVQYRMNININVTARESILKRSRASKAYNVPLEAEPLPNIVFIEIDSLSESASRRHLLKTSALLKSHGIVKNEEHGVHCPSGFCAATFSKTSIVGRASIPNQLAALSGCSDQKLPGVDAYWRVVRNHTPLRAWCLKGDLENPLLYNYLPKLGYSTFFGEEFCYTKSPWVIQGNVFKLQADYQLNELFCQLAQVTKENDTKFKNWPLYAVEHDTSSKPNPCVDGRSRQEFAFEYMRGMWGAYPGTPKFAYLNALAAHDYSLDNAYQPLGVEAYDEYLSSFLREILSHQEANNTIFVLRSDHGLQGGPAPIDFSTQVEHIHPWNNIIVPANFRQGSWIRNLFSNQNRLITGYDLYTTLRMLVVPHQRGTGEPMKLNLKGYLAGIPDWSYDLLSQTVPEDRSCKEAKVPIEFCPCLEERNDLMPYFYVGQAEKSLDGNKIKEDEEEREDWWCKAVIPSWRNDSRKFQKIWRNITETINEFPGHTVSGGLFLYKRQTNLLAKLIQNLSNKSTQASSLRPLQICETGFGAGHSSSFFLTRSETIQLVTFDKFDRPYQGKILSYFEKEKFQNRIKAVKGDSCRTLPMFFQDQKSVLRCDLLHGSSLCSSDNIDLVNHAQCGTLLTSTAMETLNDEDVYFGPNAQWRKLRERNCIENIVCFEEESQVLDRSFVFAEKGKEFQHQFCFAVVTGTCTRKVGISDEIGACEKRKSTMRDLLNSLCPNHRIPVPP